MLDYLIVFTTDLWNVSLPAEIRQIIAYVETIIAEAVFNDPASIVLLIKSFDAK